MTTENLPPVADARSFQTRVQPWLIECFGAEIAADKVERNHRFLEEALELVQACGCTASEAHQLVDYTYERDQGEINQEVGGVMVTLAGPPPGPLPSTPSRQEHEMRPSKKPPTSAEAEALNWLIDHQGHARLDQRGRVIAVADDLFSSQYGSIHTNTVEGFWAILKRAVFGQFHHISPQYLGSYLSEIVFRYNHRSGGGFEALLKHAVQP